MLHGVKPRVERDSEIGDEPTASYKSRGPVRVPRPQLPKHAMDPRVSSMKRQKVATVESALFSPDVAFLVAAFLDARDLCRVSLTCKALGGRQPATDSLSLMEEAARRQFEQSATEWERSCLPKYVDEGWIELYRHLLLLRSKLTFDQLVGANIQCGADQSTIRACPGRWTRSSALCSNHVMRSGRHFAHFTALLAGNAWIVGLVRPVRINGPIPGELLKNFSPAMPWFSEYLTGQRTERWNDSDVHCCGVDCYGIFVTYTCNQYQPTKKIDSFRSGAPFGLLLDLDVGTLYLYQTGRRLAKLKDGLSGEYCWYAAIRNASIMIKRSSAPDN